MIGKLKRVSVREVYQKKVVRVEIDVPFDDVKGREMDDDDLMEWLNHRVTHHVGFNLTTLDEQEQDVIEKSQEM